MNSEEAKRQFMESLNDIEDDMAIVLPRIDIYQDKIIYHLCRAVWRILIFLVKKIENGKF